MSHQSTLTPVPDPRIRAEHEALQPAALATSEHAVARRLPMAASSVASAASVASPGETKIRRSDWNATTEAPRRQPAPFDGGPTTKIRRRVDDRPIDRSLEAAPQASPIPIAHVQRSSQIIRRWWPFGKKDKKDEKPKEFDGRAGKTPTATEEVGKATIGAGGFAGGAKVGAEFAGAGLAAGGAAGLWVLLAGDAAMGLNNARKMNNEANEYGDAAMSKAAGRKAKDQTWGMGMRLTMAAKGGALIGQAVQHGGSPVPQQSPARRSASSVAARWCCKAHGEVVRP